MQYKFIVTGDTNDGDNVSEFITVNDEIINNYFYHIDTFIDENGKMINKDLYRKQWAIDCDDPDLINTNDEDTEISLMDVMCTFIPSGNCFSHTIERIDVLVEHESDFVNFNKTKMKAHEIFEIMNSEKMKKYMRIERNKRI